MIKVDFFNDALEKMKPKHVFIAVLVSILMVSVPPIITVSRTSSTDKALAVIIENQDLMARSLSQANWGLSTILSGNNNNLTMSSAKDIIKATMNSSQYRIIMDVEGILNRNHIDDSSRRVVIKEGLRIRINNYYNADHSSMTRLYYNNHQLSSIWEGIDPDFLLNSICKILFSNEDRGVIHSDVISEINNKFEGYYEQANYELNKMSVNPKQYN